MKNIKMSDVWKYPEHFSMFNITLIGDSIIRSNFTLEEAEAIRTAVVNHDRLTEENARLKADNAELVNLLREARESGVWHRNLTKLIQKYKDTNNDDT